MPGTLTVTLALNDISDASDAIEQGTLMALLALHRSDLIVHVEEDEDDT